MEPPGRARHGLGKSRYFKEFLASPEGIATNILADRLTRLECSGIIAKQPDPENRSRTSTR